jgi:hypothetical protein
MQISGRHDGEDTLYGDQDQGLGGILVSLFVHDARASSLIHVARGVDLRAPEEAVPAPGQRVDDVVSIHGFRARLALVRGDRLGRPSGVTVAA